MAVNVSDLAVYLRLPPDRPEQNLRRYLEAAKSKARAAGVPDYSTNALYDMYILSLASLYYENRSMAFSGSYQATAEENARKLTNSFILELRYAGEDIEGSV